MEQNNGSTVTIDLNGGVQESKKIIKNFSIDKSSLLIIVLLFMFSSRLWDIAWDIGKSLLYIIIIIYLISFVNQDLADNIKNIIHDFTNVNSNNNIITDLLAKLSGSVKGILNIGQTEKTSTTKVIKKPIQSEQKVEEFKTITHTSLYDGSGYLSGGNSKNLSNISRPDSKNIFA
jgi:hypothetical protein